MLTSRGRVGGWIHTFHLKRGERIDKGQNIAQLLLKLGRLLVREFQSSQTRYIPNVNLRGRTFAVTHSRDVREKAPGLKIKVHLTRSYETEGPE